MLTAAIVAITAFYLERVPVTARNGVVHLASSDSNADQRERVVEVVGRVPGVAGVETDMK